MKRIYVTHENQTVAQLLLRYLELEGVNKLFGIPGAAVMHILNELKMQQNKFDYIVCRQETGAAYMADGYARVTGKLGVVLVTSGPGATNALTGTMNAQNSNSALLTITGEIPEQYFGKGYLQEGVDAELNIDAVYQNACQYSAMSDNASNFQALFTQALRNALSIPRRATHINIPDDVAKSTINDIKFPRHPSDYRTIPQSSNPQQVKQAFEYLIHAKRPLIFLGNGCRHVCQGERLEKLKSFVHKFAIPVMTTADGKGIFPESDFLSLRNYGIAAGNWPQYYLEPGYDALMVLGSSLGQLATKTRNPNRSSVNWDPILIPNGRLIQVDLDQSIIGRGFPIDLGIVAEIGMVIDQLFTLSEDTLPDEPTVMERWKFIEYIKKEYSPVIAPEKQNSSASPILPQALMKCINEHLPAGSHVFVDAGNCVGWALHYLEIDPPCQLHSALSMGPMGFAVGAVIGGKIGVTDRTCVAIVGDGAFLMHGNEISTAAQNRVGAIWIVLYDNDMAMVSQGMNEFFPDPLSWKDYYKLGSPNLVKFAEALGADAFEICSPEEMIRVFSEAIANAETRQKPQVIIAHINTDEMPPYYSKLS